MTAARRTRSARRGTRRPAACARPPDTPRDPRASRCRRRRARRAPTLRRRGRHRTLSRLAAAIASSVIARSGCLMSAPSSGTAPSGGQEHLGRIGRTQQQLALVADRRLQARVQRKALASQADRRLKALLQGQLAELAGEIVERRGLAGNGRRQRPIDRGSGDRIAALVEVHVAGRGGGRLFACIEHGLEAVGLAMNQVESAAADARSSSVRPPRARPTPPLRHRMRCRLSRIPPGPRGSPADTRSRSPLCEPRGECAAAQPRARGRSPAAAGGASRPNARIGAQTRNASAAPAANARLVRTAAADAGAAIGRLKACGAVSVRFPRWDARTRTHCRPARRFPVPRSRR